MEMDNKLTFRIKTILDLHKINPARLADELQINRSRLSHILNGRNNPSLEIVQGILQRFADINPDWLLFGKDPVSRIDVTNYATDLFGFTKADKTKPEVKEMQIKDEARDAGVIKSSEVVDNLITNSVTPNSLSKGKIKRVIVLFENNEYQEFSS
jgi:transcriptional regulator with XRE-family HTH domain